MASISTVTVGLNAQPLAPAPVAGAAPDVVTVINLDTANTVNLGSTANQLGLALGPLASITLTAPVWAGAASEQLQVGIIPGGGGYSPGSLTITGPVTAEITGPVTVEGTVDIGSTVTAEITGTVDADVTGTVAISSGTVDATVSGTVEIDSGSVTFTNDVIDVIGDGGSFPPGTLANIHNNGGSFTVAAADTTIVAGSPYDVSTYSSIVFSQGTMSINSTSAGAAICTLWQFTWQDSAGTTVAIDSVSCIIGNTATWEIPVRGSQLQVGMVNVGGTGVITCPAHGFIVDGSYRVIPAIRAVNGSLSVAPVISGCTVVDQADPVFSINGWLAAYSATWGSAAVVVVPFPVWVGPVSGWYQVITTALGRDATIVDLTYAQQSTVVAGTGYAFGMLENLPSAIQSSPVEISFSAPPTQLALIYEGTSSAGSIFLNLTGV